MNEELKKIKAERDILFTTIKHQNYLLNDLLSNKENPHGFTREEEYKTKDNATEISALKGLTTYINILNFTINGLKNNNNDVEFTDDIYKHISHLMNQMLTLSMNSLLGKKNIIDEFSEVIEEGENFLKQFEKHFNERNCDDLIYFEESRLLDENDKDIKDTDDYFSLWCFLNVIMMFNLNRINDWLNQLGKDV